MSEFIKALRWIATTLNSANIEFQIAGGLAARAYGSTREIVDIDIYISEKDLDAVVFLVKNYITRKPEHHIGDLWDLVFLEVEYDFQKIELCVAESAMIYDTTHGAWISAEVDLSNSNLCAIEGLFLPVMPQDKLIRYKKILGRDVDISDIHKMTS